MSYSNRRVCRVDTLTSVAGRTINIYSQIRRINLNVHIFRLGKNRNRRGGRMYSSARLGLGDALYSMYSALIFQSGIRSLSRNIKHNFFYSAQLGIIRGQSLSFEMISLRVARIHPEQIHTKKSRFFPACARAYL